MQPLLTLLMQQTDLTITGEAFDNFVNTVKSPATKAQYIKAIMNYMKFLKVSTLEELLKGDAKLIQARIISFVMSHREKGLSTSLIQLRLSALKHFYSSNDMTLNWDKIYSFIGQPTKKHKNRPYKRDEIARMLSVSMQRDRLIILLLTSTGMRVGAVTDLQLGHLKRIEKYNLYQITVYEGSPEEYTTFCTPECAKEIDTYLDYRRKAGEKITIDSYLIREYFDINDNDQVTRPKQIKTNTIQFQIHQKLIHAGIREGHLLETEQRGTKRHEIRMSHGFRKFFHTTLTLSGVHNLIADMLTGHKNGLKASYLMPTEQELLEGKDNVKGYASAINDLTINEENRLQIKVTKLNSDVENALLFNLKFLHTVAENSTLDQNVLYIEKFLANNPQYKEQFDRLIKGQNAKSS
jgi:integrase